ncbi:MAG TPA: aminomethyl-transferring glycine dehydrogenase, partial [Leptospiraceae bacterium]|nr:aminomethyl-transferring glycine dehydrogenase [Leptospiraceae bacterium]
YFATKDEFKRNMPGRLVGVSKDSSGRPAFRLSLQTREQHIRRDKATSNICTAQVLLAVLSSFYAVYHGPNGLKRKAERIHSLASALNSALKEAGHEQLNESFFDTLKVRLKGTDVSDVRKKAETEKLNFRYFEDGCIGISIPETAEEEDLNEILSVLSTKAIKIQYNENRNIPDQLKRTSAFLTHPVFNSWHSETEMMRYIHRLESRDLALNTAMIPLGSCTMKLNAVTEMIPVTWKNFSDIHPFAPKEQAAGYFRIFDELKTYLCEITGFSAVSLQPNAGSQGEYAGLLTIRNYDISRGQRNRNICLIPVSAHGTNPASAVMAGYTVVPVACDSDGNVDLNDLRKKCGEHSQNIGVLMITYPSTHGVFEETVREICTLIHSHGAHVYMDGANMNAQVGLCRPADIGADVCHLNLHKTFCIPHGGGGPGVGPIGVRKHLEDFLPGHILYDNGSGNTEGSVTSSPFGSANILLISYVYIRLMGAAGLKEATMTAILNANYISKKLEKHYPTLYKGKNGLAAHECILDFRQFKSAGVEVEDIAKRLMDYGFHAPTMSWPVPGTLMVEPTESESLYELDRFIEAMIHIREEIRDAEENRISRTDNPLKNSPHTAEKIASENWTHPYSREKAAYPVKGLRDFKFWPYVGRIDNVYGDRNLFCSCLPMEDYEK